MYGFDPGEGWWAGEGPVKLVFCALYLCDGLRKRGEKRKGHVSSGEVCNSNRTRHRNVPWSEAFGGNSYLWDRWTGIEGERRGEETLFVQ